MLISYPPYIEGKLPSFYKDVAFTIINIPFTMNPAVSQDSFKGMNLKIKSLYDNTLLLSTESIYISDNIATFYI